MCGGMLCATLSTWQRRLAEDVAGVRFDLGCLTENSDVLIKVKLSVERGDCEIPYVITYRGAAPTITPASIP